MAVVGKDIFWHGIRLPRTALRIEFTSRVCRDRDDSEFIEVLGRLSMEPRTAFGRVIMYKVFRRPRNLGSIKYLLRLEDCSADREQPRTSQPLQQTGPDALLNSVVHPLHRSR